MSAPHTKMALRVADIRTQSRRRAMGVGAVVVLVLGLIWLVGFSSALAVRQVQVEGASGSLAAQVTAASQSVIGRPMLRADGAAVKSRVARLGPVESVEVSKSFPSTVVVRVSVRIAVLGVAAADGHHYLVDRTGLAYQQVKTVPAGVPVIALQTKIGPRDQPGLLALASVMDALPPAQRTSVTQVALGTDGAVSFALGQVKVRWGDASQSPLKARTLTAMQPTMAQQRSTSIDLSAPDRPILS